MNCLNINETGIPTDGTLVKLQEHISKLLAKQKEYQN